MQEATLITVFGLMAEDAEGNPTSVYAYFQDKSAANSQQKEDTGKTSMGKPQIKEFDAVHIDGLGTYILADSEPIEFADDIDKERERALKKLTKRERELLGVKER